MNPQASPDITRITFVVLTIGPVILAATCTLLQSWVGEGKATAR